jgi:RNA polymerase sigma-70 factor, ECF subfamily
VTSQRTCSAGCAASRSHTGQSCDPFPGGFAHPFQAVNRQEDIHSLADEEVMHLVQAGNSRAFELLYDRHGGPAFSLAYRMVGNRVTAEDISQEAFLSIWRSRARYQAERGSVRTWVLGIVHHRAIDALRRNLVHEKRRSSAEGIEERFEAKETTPGEAARREEARSVRSALAELPDEQTRVVELAYFGGFSHSQIADMLEMPIGTVKGRMRLGLDKLRTSLAGVAA